MLPPAKQFGINYYLIYQVLLSFTAKAIYEQQKIEENEQCSIHLSHFMCIITHLLSFCQRKDPSRT